MWVVFCALGWCFSSSNVQRNLLCYSADPDLVDLGLAQGSEFLTGFHGPPCFKCQSLKRLLLFGLAKSTGLLFCLMSVLLPQGKDENIAS